VIGPADSRKNQEGAIARCCLPGWSGSLVDDVRFDEAVAALGDEF
jgi:hypothetical protein